MAWVARSARRAARGGGGGISMSTAGSRGAGDASIGACGRRRRGGDAPPGEAGGAERFSVRACAAGMRRGRGRLWKGVGRSVCLFKRWLLLGRKLPPLPASHVETIEGNSMIGTARPGYGIASVMALNCTAIVLLYYYIITVVHKE